MLRKIALVLSLTMLRQAQQSFKEGAIVTKKDSLLAVFLFLKNSCDKEMCHG